MIDARDFIHPHTESVLVLLKYTEVNSPDVQIEIKVTVSVYIFEVVTCDLLNGLIH